MICLQRQLLEIDLETWSSAYCVICFVVLLERMVHMKNMIPYPSTYNGLGNIYSTGYSAQPDKFGYSISTIAKRFHNTDQI